ncbi:MAG TPA: Do family serine endopeptidase [Dongiaceae bacterium]|jgi:Do/DeqQ family serine protease|nr:Do family serine endopeptidase [Dongiaceae bacterium]
MPIMPSRAAILALAFAALLAPLPVLAGMPVVGSDGQVPSLAPLVKQVTPAVVNIAVKGRVKVDNPMLSDPFFRKFFDLPEGPVEREVQAAGSGVIVDARAGYVMTNGHVVEHADAIVVTLKDNRRFNAKLVGVDSGTDIALLKIDAQNLTAMAIGDSDRLEVGDYVLAIGNPFGLGQTVTSGIVSALGRSGLGIENYENFIQTDASINPGNSGGALINLRGELVGINTAILAPSGGNVGIGFAVPINMAKSVMQQIVTHGEVRRGRLGVQVQDVTPDLAEAMRLTVDGGAVVSQVEAGSAAKRAGIQAGDVILAVDGQPVRGASDLRNRIGLMPVGRNIDLTILREGAQRTLSVRLAQS